MLQEKVCTKCKVSKPLGEFGIRKSRNNSPVSQCYKCLALSDEIIKKTKYGLLRNIYSEQRHSSRRRCHPMPNYVLKDFRIWALNQPLFHILYDNWVESEFDMYLRPSFDRTDDTKGYSLDRLQLMTWANNKAKGYADIRSGKTIHKVNPQKAVVGIHKITGDKIYYHSLAEAARQLGISAGNISSCCNKKRGCYTIGGYKWEFNIKI